MSDKRILKNSNGARNTVLWKDGFGDDWIVEVETNSFLINVMDMYDKFVEMLKCRLLIRKYANTS